ncbi:hypothetical protein J6590_052141 [Homalodisca vitripennis]|nr:hypothetical protein J6590_052141 [Homalodisca vitripennis]
MCPTPGWVSQDELVPIVKSIILNTSATPAPCFPFTGGMLYTRSSQQDPPGPYKTDVCAIQYVQYLQGHTFGRQVKGCVKSQKDILNFIRR